MHVNVLHIWSGTVASIFAVVHCNSRNDVGSKAKTTWRWLTAGAQWLCERILIQREDSSCVPPSLYVQTTFHRRVTQSVRIMYKYFSISENKVFCIYEGKIELYSPGIPYRSSLLLLEIRKA